MIVTAFLLGFAGSLHCLAMCTPLAIAVTNIRSRFFLNRVVYNAGRILTYGILGMLISSVGELLQLGKLQNILTLSLGAILILGGVMGFRKISMPLLARPFFVFQSLLKKLFAGLLKTKSLASLTFLGMLNGLLPCGLTFIALTYCSTLPELTDGFIFMAAFGAGTLPVMLGFTGIAAAAVQRWNFSARGITAVVMIGMGCLLLSRSVLTHRQHHAVINGSDAIVICR